MTITNLNRVVDGSFVRRFQGLAAGAASSSNPLRGGASSVSITDGLRLGARTFATAVQGLNATISFVNISRNTLTQLGKVVGDMVSLADQASKRGVGSEGRADLNFKFKKLVEKFRQVVDNSEIGDDDYLSAGGISAILRKMGLTEETSTKLQRIFDAFALPKTDDAFASELYKASRPLLIPDSVFDAPVSKTKYRLKNLSNYSGDIDQGGGGIGPSGGVFLATDTLLNQNPGASAAFAVDQNGTVTSQGAGTLVAPNDITAIMDVNQYNVDSNSLPGYSVVKSTGNLVNNYNPSNEEMLFLLDETGQVVSQLTPGGALSGTIRAFDMSPDGLTYAISLYDSGFGESSVYRVTLPSVGADPSLYSVELINTFVGEVTEVQYSPDTDYVLVKRPAGDAYELYHDNNDGTWSVHGGDGNGAIVSAGIQASFVAGAEGRVMFFNTSGATKVLDWANTNADSPSGITVTGAAGAFTTLAFNSVDPTTGYFSFVDGTNVRLYSLDATGLIATAVDLNASDSLTEYNLGSGASVARLSIAQRSDGYVDVGAIAAIPETGDSDFDLYRLSFNTQSLPGRKVGLSSNEPAKILDYDLSTRPEAYRALQDLKKLQEQIKENLEVLEDVTKFIGANLDLVRAAGFAFLELSNQLTDETDAEKVAAKLRDEIRKNARGSLAQAENLTSIVVASLTYGS